MIIPRNEMGHRYYTEEHLRIFSQIKDMKERGYQLRAIRAILSGEEPPEPVFTEILDIYRNSRPGLYPAAYKKLSEIELAKIPHKKQG